VTDHLAFVRDDHLRTMITDLERVVAVLATAAPVGENHAFFEEDADLIELAGKIATVADYLADLREQNHRYTILEAATDEEVDEGANEKAA
jgi:hypothetical protein